MKVSKIDQEIRDAVNATLGVQDHGVPVTNTPPPTAFEPNDLVGAGPEGNKTPAIPQRGIATPSGTVG
jgi:hypothetical protein